jgi:predicted nucleotidyltransferase component of viral defense system
LNINLISKEQLSVISRKLLKYPLQTSEKDYFLALTLMVIYNSNLADELVFKGGTALHHIYLPQYRFSEDLDFTSPKRKITEENMIEIFNGYNFFNVKKTYSSPITVKVEKLQYSGVLEQPNSLKIDVSNIDNVALKPKTMKYKNVWGFDFTVKVMDILEICAEKIHATSGRIRYRDFYDLFLIINELNVNMSDAIELLHSKDVQKPIVVENIKENWNYAKQAKHSDLTNILLRKEVKDEDLDKFISKLKFKEIKANHKFIKE